MYSSVLNCLPFDCLDKYHGKGGPLYVGKLKENYLSDYFVNAAKEFGYQEKDQNSEQTEGIMEQFKQKQRMNFFM